jgi:hypothetical protein
MANTTRVPEVKKEQEKPAPYKVYFAPSTYRRLKAVAALEGKSVSQVLADMTDRSLPKVITQ